MRVISPKTLREFWQQHPDAQNPLQSWLTVARCARWRNLAEARHDWPSADETRDVASGKPVTIFNVGGNKYRLIAGVHYNRLIVFTLRVMTHAEYSKDRWKEQL